MSAIDHSNETLITIKQAAKKFPGKPHVTTVWRWVLHGIHGIKLDSVKVGGRRFTSEESIKRFIDQTTALAESEQLPARTNRRRLREIEQAENELLEKGV